MVFTGKIGLANAIRLYNFAYCLSRHKQVGTPEMLEREINSFVK
jgi:hypothetical protein